MYILCLTISFTAVTYTTEPDSSRRKNEIVSVVLTTTSETEAGLELLVTVATPDTQQDLVIEGTFETGSYCCFGEISCNWTWLIQGPTANYFVTVPLSIENVFSSLYGNSQKETNI